MTKCAALDTTQHGATMSDVLTRAKKAMWQGGKVTVHRDQLGELFLDHFSKEDGNKSGGSWVRTSRKEDERHSKKLCVDEDQIRVKRCKAIDTTVQAECPCEAKRVWCIKSAKEAKDEGRDLDVAS